MGDRLALPIADIARRYGAGESTYALGRAYGVDPKTIQRRLHEASVELRGCGVPGNKNARNPGGPLSNNGVGYLGTYDREGKHRTVHRACWEAYRGPIPDGCVIHHVNGDTLDNGIENLSCMADSEHKRMHATVQHAERRKRQEETTHDREGIHGAGTN